MADIKKVINGLKHCCSRVCPCDQCAYWNPNRTIDDGYCGAKLNYDAIELLKEQEKEIKALRLLVEWAKECDFGFDQFPNEYERYKEEIKGMNYTEGMIHVAKRVLEDNGAFKDGE